MPEGVTSTALALGEDRDLGVATVLAPRGGKAAATGGDAAEGADESEGSDES